MCLFAGGDTSVERLIWTNLFQIGVQPCCKKSNHFAKWKKLYQVIKGLFSLL